MKPFFHRHRWAVIALSGSIAWTAGFAYWVVWYSAVPLNAPIALSRAGHVEQDFEVRSEAPLELALVFEIGAVPRQTAMALIGEYSPFGTLGRRNEPSGIDVPLRWSITDSAGVVRASGEGSTYGRDAFGTTDIIRYVTSPIQLDPKRYRLSADVLADLPELNGMSAHIRLSRPGRKSSFEWRDDLLFFGGLINLLAVLPFVLLLATFLVLMAIFELRRKHRV